MTEQRRAVHLLLAVTLGLSALGGAGCSAGGSGIGENPLIGVQVSPLWITVENKAGMALTNLQIDIVPAGTQLVYTANHWRLENGEKRDFAANTFRSRDNTPFNIRVSRPKSVRVSAKDLSGKVLQTEVPWK